LTYALLPSNFVAMDCTQFPEILSFGNFFPGTENFRDPGKSSPVNIRTPRRLAKFKVPTCKGGVKGKGEVGVKGREGVDGKNNS